MSGSLREILPRNELKRLDRRGGSYPTNARTGDRRKGNNRIFFDDLNTVLFTSSSNSTVSYPITLPTRSKFLAFDLTSSITSSRGNVDKVAVDQWVTYPTQTEALTPFIEHKLFEQNINKTGSFYQTGSSLTSVGLGFTTNLGSKTQIRIEIPVVRGIRMGSTQASVFYLNTALQRFEEVAVNRKRNLTVNAYPFNDVMLFDPFGNNTFGDLPTMQSLFPFNANAIGQFFCAALSIKPNEMIVPNALADGSFTATASNHIDMSQYITKPFLLEKAVIEVPMTMGTTWFQDTTQYRGVANITSLWHDDGGGPCITFSLLNNFKDRRDLILSGTVIPSGDDTDNIRIDTKTDDAGFAGGGVKNIRSFNGFRAMGTPSAVIQSASNGRFTGSVVMQTIAAISNGVLTQKPYNYFPFSIEFEHQFAALVNLFGRASFPDQPSGRSAFGKEYVMPKQTSVISHIKTIKGPLDAGVYDYPDFFNFNVTEPSPYLLYPTDKLTLAASKHRAIALNLGANTYTSSLSHEVYLATGTIHMTLYGSILTDGVEKNDTLNQRLETNEIHETIIGNDDGDQFTTEYFQSLSASSIAEKLTGSLFAEIPIYGGFYPGNRLVWADTTHTASYTQTLEVIENSSGDFSNYSDLRVKKKERFALFRNIQIHSSNERFFDSMVPSLEQVFLRDGSALYGIQYVLSPCGTPSPIGAPILQVNFDVKYTDPSIQNASFAMGEVSLGSNVNWTKCFPFEPRYSGVLRQLNAGDILYKRNLLWACGTPVNTLKYDESVASKVLVAGTPWYHWGGETSAFYSFANNGLRKDSITKLCYGIGDLNTYPNAAKLALVSAGCGFTSPASDMNLYGCTQFPEPRVLFKYGFTINTGSAFQGTACPWGTTGGGNDWYRGAIIRGWKYGLINGFAQYTKAMWRFDRFGQPRDMLEQRLDSKFYEAQGYKFDGSTGGNIGPLVGPVQVRFFNHKNEITKPEFTYSSNLSFESTSSLPYFDDRVRNREEPINLSNLGLTVVT